MADYLIVFQCLMALRDDKGLREMLRSNFAARDRVINTCEQLHRQLPVAKARELGAFLYDGLILQLRSMGPGLLVDCWIRQHCPDLHEAQEQGGSSEITNNLVALQPSTRANYPSTIYEASIAMNAAYAVFGGDLVSKPYMAVPYLSVGRGPLARRLIALALGDPEWNGFGEGQVDASPTDRTIIDSWAQELGISSWHDWSELTP